MSYVDTLIEGFSITVAFVFLAWLCYLPFLFWKRINSIPAISYAVSLMDSCVDAIELFIKRLVIATGKAIVWAICCGLSILFWVWIFHNVSIVLLVVIVLLVATLMNRRAGP